MCRTAFYQFQVIYQLVKNEIVGIPTRVEPLFHLFWGSSDVRFLVVDV